MAAEMAYRDAYLSHRRQGVYGAMLFSAAIAAAFRVKDPLEAIRIGLTEIPANCQSARHIQPALAEAPRITTYCQARQAVEQRFAGMEGAHTVNNACLTIFGLAIRHQGQGPPPDVLCKALDPLPAMVTFLGLLRPCERVYSSLLFSRSYPN